MTDEITKAKAADLIPDVTNANQHTARGEDMVSKSIAKHGFRFAGTLDKDNRIVHGNNRHEQAGAIGLEDVVIVEADPNKQYYLKFKDLNLADDDNPAREIASLANRTAQVSIEFNPEQVMTDMAAGLDLSSMFFENEIEEIRADFLKEEPKEPPPQEPGAAEKAQEIWQVKPGDAWQLGRHKIACIDSLDAEAVKALVGEDVVGMVWADPPYGINIVAANVSVGGGEAYDIPFGGVKKKETPKGLGSSNGAKPFGSKKIRRSDGSANLVEVGKYYPVKGDDTTNTAIKASTLLLGAYPNACHFWWGGNYYTNTLPPSPCWIIWDKDNTGNFADCEMAWTNQPTAARIFEHRWNGMLKASEHGQKRIHPTQKPVALFEWVANKYFKDGGTVFDPFLGSGMSVIGAENIGDSMSVVGCELSPEYIAVVIQRWVDLTGETPELIGEYSDG